MEYNILALMISIYKHRNLLAEYMVLLGTVNEL